MKSIVLRLALILAAFTVVPDALAADSGDGNFFLNAKLGQMSSTSDLGDVGPSTQRHSSWGADAGYLWNIDDANSLGFEVGYMHFGKVADDIDALGFTTGTISANAMTAGALFRHSLSDDEAWYFQARAGLMWAKFDSSSYSSPPVGPPSTSSDSWHESGVYFGLGIGRQITRNFSLSLAYTGYDSADPRDNGGQKIDLSMEWVGLEAECRF